jgi:hypothetical protein
MAGRVRSVGVVCQQWAEVSPATVSKQAMALAALCKNIGVILLDDCPFGDTMQLQVLRVVSGERLLSLQRHFCSIKSHSRVLITWVSWVLSKHVVAVVLVISSAVNVGLDNPQWVMGNPTHFNP